MTSHDRCRKTVRKWCLNGCGVSARYDAPNVSQQPNTEYRPRGAADELFSRRDKFILIEGPAGTGKTRAVLEKCLAIATKYPGARILLCRKTKVSMAQSVLVTFERDVLPPNSYWIGSAKRRGRSSYNLPNGSEIVILGCDEPTRIMSAEYDVIAFFEATELIEDEFEMITSRLRSGPVPYKQAICDCNPGSPRHWLNQRAEKSKMLRLVSRHEDNPMLWDASKKDWTQTGRDYIHTLDQLTGPRLMRLRFGRWVVAEGVVYEMYDALTHVWKTREKVPKDARRIVSVDFGFNHPFVAQWWWVRDGTMICYRQIYLTQTLVEDHGKRMRGYFDIDGEPEALICDHDAEGRATLEKYTRLATVAADKEVTTGIQDTAAMLRGGGPHNQPRIFFMPDSVDQIDQNLVDHKRPYCTEHEFDCYIWKSKQDKSGMKDEPIKDFDDGMDAMRYAVRYVMSGEMVTPLAPTAREAGLVGERPTLVGMFNTRSDDDEW